MIKKAMILAAGFGKRIHPLTIKKPKPLLEIGKETLLSNTLKFLSQLGINHVVINVHYLAEQIIEYVKNNNFNLNINIIEEKEKILDTGGGVLNVLNYFSNEPFLIINPDTVWNFKYLEEVELMKKNFFENKKIECLLLVVNKKKSSDQSLKGDFNIKNNLITRRKNDQSLEFIYTGIQIVKPNIFMNFNSKVFSINEVWNNLIEKNKIYGVESNIEFIHVSTLEVYKNLNIK